MQDKSVCFAAPEEWLDEWRRVEGAYARHTQTKQETLQQKPGDIQMVNIR